jgi:hypothetical protein
VLDLFQQERFGDGRVSMTEINTYLEFGILIGTAFISAIGAAWIALKEKSRRDKKKEQEKCHKETTSIFDDKQKNFQIYDRLMYLRIKSSADRVRLCQFHNGGKFLSGAPMKKFTSTHETTSKGVSNESEKLQNCVTTVFHDKIMAIKENDPKIHFVSDLTIESKSKNFYKSTEVEKFAVLPLFKNDLTIGFIEVEWNEGSEISYPNDFESIFTLVRSQIEFEMMKGD